MEAEVMTAMRMRILIVLAVLMVSACGRVSQAAPGSGYRLYEAAARQDAPIVALIDTRSHEAQSRLPLGVPSPDWTRYYAASSSSLLVLDPQTGVTQARIPLRGDYLLPPVTNSGMLGGLSHNGRWLVLERFDRQAQNTARASHFLVFDTSTMNVRRSIDLDGYFQFDAISNDGERMFLIQFINGTDYHVRDFSVSGGVLDPSFVIDKYDGDAAMNGLKLSGLASPDGAWLYSVYARAHKGAFIHALFLDGTLAFCLDLPGKGFDDGDSSSLAWSLALSPGGNRLYAVNPVLGVVTEVITSNSPEVARTAYAGEPSHVWPAGAVMSADGQTLVMAGPAGITWLDTIALKPKGQALTAWTVRSLALSPDGATLYALNDAGEVAELSMAGHSVTTTFDPSIAHPIALMRVEALP
ncbi:MAG TPA: hypothetical protein VFL29_00035 [Candidatus Dormibacteraeota bacterium]|nr:hypothetical protein [Candidatus Dormibacteraeota bacterium]